ncbi:hypothetical protein FJ492_22550 [Mesorhizobium sp. B2-5-4]|nr:hypothetical protein FJ492_22550 [Mesorhizobium sp. B2-5-4]
MAGSAPALHENCTRLRKTSSDPPHRFPASLRDRRHAQASKTRLPYRLRSEGWWLVDPPRAKPAAIVIPFVRPHRARKIHGRGPPIFRRYP